MEKKNWKGIDCQYVGRPGTSNLLNQKRQFQVPTKIAEMEERFKFLIDVFNKVGELEHQRKVIKKAEEASFGSSTAYSSKSKTTAKTGGTGGSERYVPPNAEFMTFEPISKSQFVTGPVTNHYYPRGSTLDYTELSYKLIKSEAKLVRSTLEAYGFSNTDSHDWNVLWMCVPGKPYLYEGLNEYQKINHFPNSHEITKKDRLCINILKMQERFGKEAYYIVPDTFVLPEEEEEF